MYGRILVVLDGTEQDRQTIATAARAGGPDTTLLLLAVADRGALGLDAVWAPAGVVRRELEQEAQRALARGRQTATDLGVAPDRVTGEVRRVEVDPAGAIAGCAHAWGAELAVMAAPPRSIWTALLPGAEPAAAAALARRTHVPVLLVAEERPGPAAGPAPRLAPAAG